MNYKIPVTWEMYGIYNIEADSLEEAKKIINNVETPLPPEASRTYVDDSLKIDEEYLKENYPDEQQ